MKISKDLVAASCIPLVLTILKNGDDYGYSIIKKISSSTNDELKWKEGSLYPVLTKLEKNGHLNSYFKIEDGRKRKYYSINNSGTTYLQTLKAEWEFLTNTMQNLWNTQQITLLTD